MGGTDPRLVDATVRLVIIALTTGALGDAFARRFRLCDPRCRAAVQGLVARTADMQAVAELAGDHAEKVRETFIGPLQSDP